MERAATAIERYLGEEVERDFRQGVGHLEAALNADSAENAAPEISSARASFESLIARDKTSTVEPRTTKRGTNADYAAAGRYGSYLCFLLRDDYRNAAIQAYRLAESRPELAVLLPAAMFSQPYAEQMEAAEKRLEEVEAELRKRTVSAAAARAKFLAQGGGGIAVLITAVAIPATGIGLALWFGGLAILGKNQKSPALLTTKRLRDESRQLTVGIAGLRSQVVTESRERLAYVNTHGLILPAILRR